MSVSFLSDVASMIRAELKAALPSFRWGTVTSSSPYRIRLDGDTEPLGYTVDSLTTLKRVGSRVFTVTWNRRVTILGGRDGTESSEVLTGDYSTLTAWRALPEGWYYNNNGSMTGMPTSSGFVRVRRRGNEWHVTYYSQPDGPQFRMAVNWASTTIVWERLYQHREMDTTGTVNLNDYTSPGIYRVDQTSTAANGSNFPLPHAGLLEVMGAGTMCYQRYTAYRALPGHVYYRNFWNGSWGPWEQIGRGLCSGRVTIALPTQGTVGNASVSFPTNRFSVNPAVSVSHWTTVPQNAAVSFSTLSTTGMVIHAVRTLGTGDLNVTWMASAFGA